MPLVFVPVDFATKLFRKVFPKFFRNENFWKTFRDEKFVRLLFRGEKSVPKRRVNDDSTGEIFSPVLFSFLFFFLFSSRSLDFGIFRIPRKRSTQAIVFLDKKTTFAPVFMIRISKRRSRLSRVSFQRAHRKRRTRRWDEQVIPKRSFRTPSCEWRRNWCRQQVLTKRLTCAGTPRCIEHLVWEKPWDNVSRRGCHEFGYFKPCPHEPKCLPKPSNEQVQLVIAAKRQQVEENKSEQQKKRSQINREQYEKRKKTSN
jgi:hypothetical protein